MSVQESRKVDQPDAGEISIEVTKNGPYKVTGKVELARQTIVSTSEGESIDWAEGEPIEHDETFFLCRCGQSQNKPFCDGSHARVGFDGTEVAGNEPYLEAAGEQDGPVVILTDEQRLCAFARFCDVGGQIWNLVESDDPRAVELTVREGEMCPSGRLVVWDRETKQPMEPDLPPSIGLVEDPAEGVAGPIWVRGGIPVTSADGTQYEVRNRVTLCRCGASRNKPFCDGTHAAIGFTD